MRNLSINLHFEFEVQEAWRKGWEGWCVMCDYDESAAWRDSLMQHTTDTLHWVGTQLTIC